MSVARALARRLFGRSIEVIDLEIAFHKQANHFGTHGVMIASHKDLGLKDQAVRFVFVGMSEPPAMTPRIIEYIWEEARAQGFVPTAIASYGHVLKTHSGLPPRALVSEARRRAEDGHFDRQSSALETTMQAIATAAAPHPQHVPEEDQAGVSIDSLLIKQG